MNRTASQDKHRPRTGKLLARVKGLAFWGSILLPFLYLPLISSPAVLSGSIGERELLAVAALLALNVACLLVGHDHSP